MKLPAKLRLSIGRFLAPVGIINPHHEPHLFWSVERPQFARSIVPSTWSLDGVLLSGRPGAGFSFAVGMVSGLDGAGFSSGGIRDGRIQERSGFNPPSVTGRLEYELPGFEGPRRFLRISASFFGGAVSNGAQGEDNGLDADLGLLAFSFDARWELFRLRAEAAATHLTEALPDPEVARRTLGFYVEPAVHLPGAWLRPLKLADAIVFARLEKVDTQFERFDDLPRDGAGDRRYWTGGLAVFLTPTVALKADLTRVTDAAGSEPGLLVNAGVGFAFP